MSRPATSRLKVNPPQGHRPSLENHRICDLQVDPAYQRSAETSSSLTLIRRIAMHWDWGLFQPLTVARRADGSLWIVDGQHRAAAAKLRCDMYDLPCVVTSYDSAGDEAAAFVSLNSNRRPLNAVEVWKAALAAGDEEAVAVHSLIVDAGLSVAPHQNYIAWKPGMLYCVPGIRSSYRKHGRTATSSALVAIAEAFPGQVLRFAGLLLEGLCPFYVEAMSDSGFDPDLFLDVLAGARQAEWVQDARAWALEKETSRRHAMLEVFRSAYAEASAEMLEAA